MYDIRIGAYRASNTTRLAILASDRPTENNRVVLTPLEVR